MARNRKNEVTALRPGAAFKAGLICLVIVTACVGYVWQKQQINVLAEQIGKREARVKELHEQNDKLIQQVNELYSPAREGIEARPRPGAANANLVPPGTGLRPRGAQNRPAFRERTGADGLGSVNN